MIGLGSVVRLAAMARLRFDRHANQYMLLYPERGLMLSPTAADVVTLCVEARSVKAIVESLIGRYGEPSRGAVTADVIELLRGLAERGLLDEVAS
jgi:coenzyme PQQ biosynthesis protein PqqD